MITHTIVVIQFIKTFFKKIQFFCVFFANHLDLFSIYYVSTIFIFIVPIFGVEWSFDVSSFLEEISSPSPIVISSIIQFIAPVVSDSLWTHESQHARPPCPSQTPGVYSNSCLLSRWCHPAISSSVVPFSSCRQSLPASGSFPMRQFFAWDGQSTGVSASASVLPINTQDWSSGWTGWISLQSKGLSRVFSNTTVQKHQFEE